jgi:hypothetical protein
MSSSAVATVIEAPLKQDNADQPAVEALPRYFVLAMSVYIISLNLVLVYLLVRLWPGTVPVASQSWVTLAWGKHHRFELWIETRYLLIVALSGAIGSYIHLATSFVDFVGNRRLVRSWTLWYVLRPFIGMALAVLVYFVARAGLITGTGGAESLNLYGVAAIAGMCGLFSKQATDKLREVFENLFRTKVATQRADPLGPDAETAEKRAA